MRSASAHRFAKRLAEAIGMLTGQHCECNAEDLIAARGWYRTDIRADVMRWTGVVRLDGSPVNWSVGSWEPMTSALRHGFEIIDGRRDQRSYVDFEIFAANYVHPFHRKATGQ